MMEGVAIEGWLAVAVQAVRRHHPSFRQNAVSTGLGSSPGIRAPWCLGRALAVHPKSFSHALSPRRCRHFLHGACRWSGPRGLVGQHGLLCWYISSTDRRSCRAAVETRPTYVRLATASRPRHLLRLPPAPGRVARGIRGGRRANRFKSKWSPLVPVPDPGCCFISQTYAPTISSSSHTLWLRDLALLHESVCFVRWQLELRQQQQ